MYIKQRSGELGILSGEIEYENLDQMTITELDSKTTWIPVTEIESSQIRDRMTTIKLGITCDGFDTSCVSTEFSQEMEMRSYPNCHKALWGIYSGTNNGRIYRVSMSSREMHSMIEEYERQQDFLTLLQSNEYKQIDYLKEDPLLDMLLEKVREKEKSK